MSSKKRLIAALMATFSLPALADEPTNHTFTGNIGFVSDYVFNGISQNYRTPALQGGFDYVHASGLYAGTWASAISGNQYTNASLEWDVYGGYNGKVGEDLGYTVGLLQVFYPGGKTNPAGPTKKWDTTSIILGGTWQNLNVKYTVALNDWYGISGAAGGGFEPAMWADGSSTAAGAGNVSSAGSGYIELNYSYALADDLTLSGHVGHQTIKHFDKLSYSDLKIALNKMHMGFNFGLAYTVTNATDNTLYHVKANGDDKRLGAGILAVSVSRTF